MHLDCRNKAFDGHSVLRGLDLDFTRCGMVAVIGPSGSGKSSLLNILGMLDPVYEGTLFIDDKEIPKSERIMGNYRSKAIAFVFQEFNLIRSLSVKENILTSLELSGTPFHSDRYREIMSRFHVLELENRDVGTLSGGEKQRIAIVRAILRESDIILADEPTGNLDEENSRSIMKELKEMGRDRLVIVATHDTRLAGEYADRIIGLKNAAIDSDEDFGYSTNALLSHTSSLSTPKLKSRWYWLLSIRNFQLRKRRIVPILLSMIIALLCLAMILGLYTGIGNLMNDVNRTVLESDKLIVRNYDHSLFKTMDGAFIDKIGQMAEWSKMVVYYDTKVRLSYNGKSMETKVKVLDDSEFLQERIQMLDGNPVILRNEVLLEETAARTLFGDANCIGESIRLDTEPGYAGDCTVAGLYHANNEENINILIMSKDQNAAVSTNSLSSPLFIGYADEQSDKNLICKLAAFQPSQQLILGNPIDGSTTDVLVNASGFNYLLHALDPAYAPVALEDIRTGKISKRLLDDVLGQKITLQKLDLTAFATITVSGICTETNPSDSLIFYLSGNAVKEMNQPQVNIADLYMKDSSSQERDRVTQLLEQNNITYELASDKTGSLVMVKMSVIGMILALVAFLVLLLSCLMIHFSVKVSVMDRIYEVGVLKSLGATNKIIFRVFSFDNMLLGLIVSLSSCFLVVLANITRLTGLLVIDRVSIYQFQLWHLLPILLVGGLLTMISGLKETIMVSRLSIVDAIRHKNS